MARQAMTKKLMVLGVDGMDARITKHLMDEGKMPNVKKFVDRGACREDLHLLGAIPTITPPCWTTLATGAYPGTHGITCYWRSLQKASMLLSTTWTAATAKQNRCGMLPLKLA